MNTTTPKVTTPKVASQSAPVCSDERRLKAALRGSFPASDPPSSWAGPPRQRSTACATGVEPATSRFGVGALVVDETAEPSPETVQVVVGFRDGRCLTSYVAPPPWMSSTPRFFVAEAEALRPAPVEVVEHLEHASGA